MIFLGFRGEALASISHVARLTIITKTSNSPCAYKASYSDGKLTNAGIKACAAASKGTQIIVEDLFYNSSIRRNALRSSSEEFTKIYEVVSRYALHNYHVSFFLKRLNENSVDLKTSGIQIDTNTEAKRCIENEKYLIENISIVFGNELRNELERISIDYDNSYKFQMNGYILNTKCTQLKQMIFILFINERLVDCQPLKKTLQTLFQLYMPKNSYPFIYINLKINPLNIDVNVHPTKHEVRFLYQDEIINKIQVCIEQSLLNSNVSRTYYLKNMTMDGYLQTTNTSSSTPKASQPPTSSVASASAAATVNLSITTPKSTDDSKNSPVVYPYQLTRVDSKERTLDSYKHRTSFDTSQQKLKFVENTAIDDDPSQVKSPLRKQKLDREIKLKSLNELKNSVEEAVSLNTLKIIQDFNFVGCLDNESALIQHKTGLYMANTYNLSQELFYQLALFNFGNFGYFRFKEPLSIFDLIVIALDNPESQWEPDDGDKEQLAKRCEKLFLSKSLMLDDYFSIKVIKKDENRAYLEAIPMLLNDFEPNLIELPMFMLRLATEIDWKKEKDCFDTICNEIGLFYTLKNSKQETNNNGKPEKNWIIEHVIYTSLRNFLLPSVNCEDAFFKLVDLHDLYKVFERC